MRKKFGLYLAALTSIVLLFGCKPTEKNYKQAYETAQNARMAEMQNDAELGIPHLHAIDGPRKRRVGNDSIYIKRQGLKIEGPQPEGGIQRANVAVGKYKMAANALGDAEMLSKAGFKSYVITNAYGDFFTICQGAPSLEEAVEIIKQFKQKYPDRPYIGLPGEPVVMVLLNCGL